MSRNTPVTDIANELCRAPMIESFGQFTARTNSAIERVVGMPNAMTLATTGTSTADGVTLRMQQARIHLWRLEQELARFSLERERELRNFDSIALRYLQQPRGPAQTQTTGEQQPRPCETPKPRGLWSGLGVL